MQVLEVYRLAEWFENEVIAGSIMDNYSDLDTAVERNVTSTTKTSFEKEKKVLVENLRQMDFNVLTLEQMDLLERMGTLSLFGEQGESNLHRVFNENGVDIASISEHLKKYVDIISTAETYFRDIKVNIEQFFDVSTMEELNNGESLIRVYFKDKAAINTLEDFKKSGQMWEQIGRGIALAMSVAPEDIRVVGAEKGSIIVDLVATTFIVSVISKIILEVLKITQRVLDIRKTLLEIKNLKLKNEEIQESLKEEIEAAQEEGVESILKIVTKEYNIKETDGEKKNHLKKAIELLLKFSDDGGTLDFIHSDPKDEEEISDDSEVKHIRSEIETLDCNVAEIRRLESSIKLISGDLNTKAE